MSIKPLDRILPRTPKQAFWLGLGCALLGGLCVMLIVGSLTGLGKELGAPWHDGYLQLARSLGRGSGYVFEPGGPPVTHRPPLAPVLLIPVTLVPGPLRFPVLMLLQSLLVGGTCYLLFDLARRTLGLRVARWMVLLLLLYPWLFCNAKSPTNSIAQMFLVTLVVNLIARELLLDPRAGDPPAWMKWPAFSAVLGLAMAAAILTHGTMLLSVPLLLGSMIAIGLWRKNPRTALVALAAGAVALLAVAPWTWRNWTVTKQFIPVATNGGYAYFWGNAHWRFDGDVTEGKEDQRALFLAGIPEDTSQVLHYSGIKDPRLDRAVNARMVRHMASHPRQFAKKVALNGAEYYFPVVREALGVSRFRWDPLTLSRLALTLWHFAAWTLACVAFWRQPDAAARLRLVAFVACIAALSVPYFPFLVNVAHGRYTLPTIPLLTALAAAGLVAIFPGKDPETGPNRHFAPQ